MTVKTTNQSLNRREFMVAGTAVGASAVLAGCGTVRLFPEAVRTGALRYIEGTGDLCNLSGSVSANGDTVAFAAGDEFHHDVYVGKTRLGDGFESASQFRKILAATDDDVCAVLATAVSPDGQSVACYRQIKNVEQVREEYQVVHVPLDKGAPVAKDYNAELAEVCAPAAYAKLAYMPGGDELIIANPKSMRRWIGVRGGKNLRVSEAARVDYASAFAKADGPAKQDDAGIRFASVDRAARVLFSFDSQGKLRDALPLDIGDEDHVMSLAAAPDILAYSTVPISGDTVALLRQDMRRGSSDVLERPLMDGLLLVDAVLPDGALLLTVGFVRGERRTQLAVLA